MEKHSHFKVGPLRRIIGLLFFAAAVAAVLGAVASLRAVNQPGSPEQAAALRKIAPWVTEHTAGGKQAEFMIVLADQANLNGAAALSTKNEKGRFVRDALLNKSQTTQGPVLQWLRERGIPVRTLQVPAGVVQIEYPADDASLTAISARAEWCEAVFRLRAPEMLHAGFKLGQQGFQCIAARQQTTQ